MKIILALNHFLPTQVAGTELYSFHLARFLQHNGISVSVIIPNYGKQNTERYLYEGVEVIQYAEPSIVDRELVMRKRIPDGLVYFREVIKAERPDIVHFHNVSGSNGIGLAHAREVNDLGIKILFTFHIAGSTCSTGTLLYKRKVLCDGYIEPMRCAQCVYEYKGIHGIKGKVLKAIASALYRIEVNVIGWNNQLATALAYPFLIRQLKIDLLEMEKISARIIVLTHWYKKVLLLNNIKKESLAFIPQGLPARAIPEPGASVGTDVLKIIYIGRITENKGLHLLLQSAQHLCQELLTVNIYGAESDDSYGDEWRKKTTANRNIHWHGLLPPADVMSTIAKNNILCIPSLICEMSPLVIQEAFAAGVPVLASNVYGNAEQITDGENGWLFKYNDSNDLKNKLQLLVNDPLLIEKARQHITLVKSFETVADEHEKLYKEIIAIK